VREIDGLCDRLAEGTKDEEPRLFAALWEDVGGTTRFHPWREFASTDELEEHLKVLGTYEVAEVWRAPSGSTYVRTTATSDTGDYEHVTRSCYRADGSLARAVFAVSGVEVGFDVLWSRTRHFKPDGHQLRSRSETRNLETGKRVKPPEHTPSDKIYKSVSAQPFGSLL
jgi:hypothetical protein